MTDTNDQLHPEAEGAIQQPAQAETVTVSTEPTDDGGELIAGKFKSQDDLVKAYKELESKLGQQPQQEPTDPPADETKPEDTPKEGEDDKPKDEADDELYEVYGETVGKALKDAGVDPKAASDYFDEHGTLTDEDFDKFAKAGFPKEMVEAYLRGVSQSREQATQITEAQVTQIKAAAGGEDGYAELQKWMAANVPVEDLQKFNDTVSSGDFNATLNAVTQMQARYLADVGREGNLRGGKTPAAAEGYASEAEYLEDVAKPEYKQSQAFRDKVAAKLAKSPNIFATR